MHKGNELRLSDGKKIICKYSLKKNVLRKLLFLEIVSVTKVKKQLFFKKDTELQFTIK